MKKLAIIANHDKIQIKDSGESNKFMPTRNVNLTDYYDRFIEAQLHDGKYQNASEVIRAGLSALEYQERENELKLERLRLEIQKGIDAYERGEYITLNSEQELDVFLDEIEEEIKSPQANA